MTVAALDLLGTRTAAVAVDALASSHSDRVAVLEQVWDRRATARLLPALPPGAAADADLPRVALSLLRCPARRLPLVSAWRPAERDQPARMVSASHSWAAVAVAREVAAGAPPLHLLHVDAHDDLASPRPGRIPVLDDPAAVARAVTAGRLGIGSFITPFVDAGHVASVRHVTRDGFADPPLVAASPTWLDIDLDALCNSLDDRAPEPEIDAAELERRIDALVAFLGATVRERPRLVTVALSPGFLPSAWWRPALTALEEALDPPLRLPYVSAP